ncbi:similar to Saccharomyces cerevisiae YPR042C PUF2 Member of the PUF protein family, which is defined by the presence of Pumilio homology domains that confer RNA binding activity [Maudiozyma saulgeensis]|uniref:Similar to Saccharomyces cerevisiae YPR042C PUF2 Member of the PUF protein family, which is defined by the presence of Pumilio homology domains that confer RNA binding activity n=1 Tax=Maudiozyma saulgeensis TaxID=1789683 RepID=A0A1X7R3X0_9SACH|nr:similar to Saccharomyces cerevisiae YPR042C PUF2 Member of the PUF protein family, which is defined by the presence of Pumilio homology domains that confer RNA binding activity [Kazachstania saulgeensis]
MENKYQYNGNPTTLPDIIDPGITIPIFDDVLEEPDNELSSQQPQKLGSYRVRAGKFSNTLSNLLPSISAKLHHGKKNSNGKVVTNDSMPIDTTIQTDLDYRISGEMLRRSAEVDRLLPQGINISEVENVTSTQDSDRLVHFPPSTDYLINAPRRSNDSFTLGTTLSQPMNRTRNNTMSSQITSISSMAPGPVSAGAIWGNTNTSVNDSLHQPIQTAATTANNNNSIYEQVIPSMTNGTVQDSSSSIHGKNTNMLNVPPVAMWTNPTQSRQRSASNSSSIYMDAAQFDQQSLYSHAQSNYTSNQQFHDGPLVIDDVDPRSINWVSNDPNVPSINRISTLIPTNTISISNVLSLQEQQPHLNNAVNLTSTSLATLCSKFGEVTSARTFKGINMAIVEFTTVEAASEALNSLQGKEVSMIGAPSFIAFAKILPMHQQQQYYGKQQIQQPEQIPQPLLHEQLYNGSVTLQKQGNVSVPVFNQYQQQQQQQVQSIPQIPYSQSQPQQQQSQQSHNQHYGGNYQTHTSHIHSTSMEREQCPFPLPAPTVISKMGDLKKIINSFDIERDEQQVTNLLNGVINFKGTTDTENFGPLPNSNVVKGFEASKLRELRKAMDSDSMSQIELEQLAMTMLDELPEFCSDYLGNTIVQKLFENCSDIIKDIMLRKTAKYLTSMGVHKNGTWACQKIITMAHTPRQVQLVTSGIRDYCTPLFDDQFGNYVIQCVLKFGMPWNNFIFESIISNFWTIVQNRYGARAVRACLEAHDIITKEQTLVLSSVIILYSEYLSTNANSALLLTWFLDTCVLPKRHTVLASYITKNIDELCRHRLASLTVLKILNYRGDDVARKITLQAIFGDLTSEEPPQSLKVILNNSSYGPTFIYKVLCMPLLDEDTRQHIVQQVRKVVKDSASAQQHRRLMEEIGFAPPSSHPQGNINKHTHRKTSSNVAFSPEANGHMRGPSTSSIRSNGSRQTNVISQNVPGQSANSPPNNSNANGASYFNYPGMFPGGFFGGSNGTNMIDNDDIINKFERLNLNNGTHLSLPKLSFRGRPTNGPTGNAAFEQNGTANNDYKV